MCVHVVKSSPYHTRLLLYYRGGKGLLLYYYYFGLKVYISPKKKEEEKEEERSQLEELHYNLSDLSCVRSCVVWKTTLPRYLGT